MNKFTILAVVLCIVAVNARHFVDETPDREDSEQIERRHHDSSLDSRHRRRRWQSGYRYDYPQPPPPYYPERQDYDKNQQEFSHILRLLDEISAHVKRPPPPLPPQPIYVPYLVPYPIPQLCSCTTQEPKKPNVTNRFPEMEDTNQNWGFVETDENNDDDDESDGSRPISLIPIKPKGTLKRPAPEVEHGSSQAGNQVTTKAPIFEGETPLAPAICDAAILSCCGVTEKEQQRQCFTNLGCGMSYANGAACSPDSIASALKSFQSAYSPVSG